MMMFYKERWEGSWLMMIVLNLMMIVSSEIIREGVFKDYQSPIDLSILPLSLPPPHSTHLCTIPLINHNFTNSYGKPYLGTYLPPKACMNGNKIDKVMMSFRGEVKGKQFDRFGAIFIGGSEVLRTTTAEPTPKGIQWEFEKDLTKYRSLLYEEQIVSMILGNTVDETYTGIIQIKVTLDLYMTDSDQPNPVQEYIEPISKGPPNLTTKEIWYNINDNSTLTHQINLTKFKNRNLIKAELELFLSGHECDEFYYLNPPHDYARSKDECPNGPYRELMVYLDDKLVGGIWPFPTIYTGGITLTLWRPISGLGSFDVPTDTLDLSPYLNLLSSSSKGDHEFQFKIVNATNTWFLTGNLHLIYDNEPHQPNNIINYDPIIIQDDIINLLTTTTTTSTKPTDNNHRQLVLQNSSDTLKEDDDDKFHTFIRKNYTIITLTSHPPNPPHTLKSLLTLHQLNQLTTFHHHLRIQVNLTHFNINLKTDTTITQTQWYTDHLPTTTLPHPPTDHPINSSTHLLHSHRYTLQGSSLTLQPPPSQTSGYYLSTNLTLTSITRTNSLSTKSPSSFTLLHLNTTGYAHSSPNFQRGDSKTHAIVHHYTDNPLPTNYPTLTLPCYYRELHANHGYIQKDRENRECVKKPVMS